MSTSVMSFRLPVLLALCAALAFLPVVSAKFVNWDDSAHIMNNKLVTGFSFRHPERIFLEKDSANHTYIPLTTLNWAVEYRLFGENPMVFHLSSLLQHILVVLLVFALARRFGLDEMAAFAAALLFALHPTRVENVAWATARKDTLYSLFYLVSLWGYLNYTDALARGERGRAAAGGYAIALGAGLLSVLAKPMALSLPWVLLLVDWMRGRKFSPMMLWDKLPFLALIEPVAWITYAQNTRTISFDFVKGFLVWSWSAGFYIVKFFWPGTLSPVYGMPEPVAVTNAAYLWTVVVIAATALAVWRFPHRWVLFGFGYFFLSSFFLWRFDSRDISVVADRFLYLPSFGACLAAGYGWGKLREKWRAPVAARWFQAGSLALVLALGALSFRYSFAWTDGEKLWGSVVANAPDLAFAYNNLGAMLMEKGEPEAALREFRRAIDAAGKKEVIRGGKPMLPTRAAQQFAVAYNNIGLYELKRDNIEEALKNFNLAVYYDLDKIEAYINRGAILAKQGHPGEALNDYNTALAINEHSFEALHNRGLLFYNRGEKDRALADFLKAAEEAPKNAEPLLQAGRIYFERKDYDQARDMFARAAKADEDNPQPVFNLGVIAGSLGRNEEARRYFSQALVKWQKAPDKYTLPNITPEKAAFWAGRMGAEAAKGAE